MCEVLLQGIVSTLLKQHSRSSPLPYPKCNSPGHGRTSPTFPMTKHRCIRPSPPDPTNSVPAKGFDHVSVQNRGPEGE